MCSSIAAGYSSEAPEFGIEVAASLIYATAA